MNIDELNQLTPKASARTLEIDSLDAPRWLDAAGQSAASAPSDMQLDPVDGLDAAQQTPTRAPVPPPACPLPALPQQSTSSKRPTYVSAPPAPSHQVELDEALLFRIQAAAPEKLEFFQTLLHDFAASHIDVASAKHNADELQGLLLMVFERDVVQHGHFDSLMTERGFDLTNVNAVREQLSLYISRWQELGQLCLALTRNEIQIVHKILDGQALWGTGCDLSQEQSFSRTALARVTTLVESVSFLPPALRADFMRLAASPFIEDSRAGMQTEGLGVPLQARNSEVLVRLAEELSTLDDVDLGIAPFVFYAIYGLGQAFNQLDLTGADDLLRHLCDVRSRRGTTWELHARALFELDGLRLAEAASVGEALLQHRISAYAELFAAADMAARERAVLMADNPFASAYYHAQTLRTYALLDSLEAEIF